MKFSRISIVILCFVIFCCITYFIRVTNNICEPMMTSPKILFTCTSFISKPNKLDSLKQTLDKFIHYTPTETIDRMIVINEYGENTEDSIEELKNMYPEIEFINKSENDKGQAKSINLIIDILREGNYDYWLHWEDSWILNAPFLDDSIEIMKDDNIDQLQLIDRWHDTHDERKELKITKSGKKYTEILKINDSIDEQLKPFGNCSDFKLNWAEHRDHWPLFSLSPGIDKVDKILETGYFDTSTELWPITFEFKWSIKWLCNGGRKAVINNSVCQRVDKHISTYD